MELLLGLTVLGVIIVLSYEVYLSAVRWRSIYAKTQY